MPTDHQQAAFVAVAVLVAVAALADCLDDLENLPPANQSAFEGGPTGTFQDAGINNVIQEGDQTDGDIPTGGPPSLTFGAQSFTQKMLRFEEFGTEPMPEEYSKGPPYPGPQGATGGPAEAALDAFLAQEMFPEPTRLANDRDDNPW